MMPYRPWRAQQVDEAEQLGISREELQDWKANEQAITDRWEWFDGTKLEEVVGEKPGKDGQMRLRWPLQLNPIANGARLHCYALFGEVADTSDPLVKTIVEPKDDEDEAAKKLAHAVERLLADIQYENHCRSMFLDAGLSIQALGGLVWKICQTDDLVTYPTGIRLEYFDPRLCWFHWRGTNYYDLTHAWVKYEVSAETALEYGVRLTKSHGLYVEHWTKDHYRVTIDGILASDQYGPLNRPNTYGFVPFIYLAHERAGGFWGRSIVTPDVIGLTKELNSRLADTGDSIFLGVNGDLVAKNLRAGYPLLSKMANGRRFINLGKSLSGEPEPDMDRLEAPSLPQGTEKFLTDLETKVRIGMLTPEIAYGHEEGTQRSGQTLFSRMWPLLAHCTQERVLWSEALALMGEMALTIKLRAGHADVSEAMLRHRKHHRWASMVPLDRAQLVDELIRRWQEQSISLELLLEKFGDVPNLKEEVERVLELQERQAELEKMSRPQPALGGGGSSAGGAPKKK